MPACQLMMGLDDLLDEYAILQSMLVCAPKIAKRLTQRSDGGGFSGGS
ncbi:MAG: hypothetical protein ACI9Y1_001011 [Lentisphaeria bacterium]|jgi:hypothetical protein